MVPKDCSSDALDMLVDYSWPGNVRELRNEVERLVIMVQNDVIQADDLSFFNGTGSGPRVYTSRSQGTLRTRVHPVKTRREQLEYLADGQAAGTRAEAISTGKTRTTVSRNNSREDYDRQSRHKDIVPMRPQDLVVSSFRRFGSW